MGDTEKHITSTSLSFRKMTDSDRKISSHARGSRPKKKFVWRSKQGTDSEDKDMSISPPTMEEYFNQAASSEHYSSSENPPQPRNYSTRTTSGSFSSYTHSRGSYTKESPVLGTFGSQNLSEFTKKHFESPHFYKKSNTTNSRSADRKDTGSLLQIDHLVKTSFGTFAILEVISTDFKSNFYLAEQIITKKKALLKHTLDNESNNSNLNMNEIFYLNLLNNQSSFVNFLGEKQSRNCTFIFTEYFSDQTIETFSFYRQTKFLDESLLIKLIQQICMSVFFLHNQDPPLAHFNLTPSSVLIKEQDIKISNLKFVSECSKSGFVKNSAYLRHNLLENTPHHLLPPEVLSEDQTSLIGTQCDVWSLGILLFVLCFGSPPFDESGLSSILHEKYKAPENSPYSKNIFALLDMMLCPDPRNRISISLLYSKINHQLNDKSDYRTPIGYSLASSSRKILGNKSEIRQPTNLASSPVSFRNYSSSYQYEHEANTLFFNHLNDNETVNTGSDPVQLDENSDSFRDFVIETGLEGAVFGSVRTSLASRKNFINNNERSRVQPLSTESKPNDQKVHMERSRLSSYSINSDTPKISSSQEFYDSKDYIDEPYSSDILPPAKDAATKNQIVPSKSLYSASVSVSSQSESALEFVTRQVKANRLNENQGGSGAKPRQINSDLKEGKMQIEGAQTVHNKVDTVIEALKIQNDSVDSAKKSLISQADASNRSNLELGQKPSLQPLTRSSKKSETLYTNPNGEFPQVIIRQDDSENIFKNTCGTQGADAPSETSSAQHAQLKRHFINGAEIPTSSPASHVLTSEATSVSVKKPSYGSKPKDLKGITDTTREKEDSINHTKSTIKDPKIESKGTPSSEIKDPETKDLKIQGKDSAMKRDTLLGALISKNSAIPVSSDVVKASGAREIEDQTKTKVQIFDKKPIEIVAKPSNSIDKKANPVETALVSDNGNISQADTGNNLSVVPIRTNQPKNTFENTDILTNESDGKILTVQPQELSDFNSSLNPNLKGKGFSEIIPAISVPTSDISLPAKSKKPRNPPKPENKNKEGSSTEPFTNQLGASNNDKVLKTTKTTNSTNFAYKTNKADKNTGISKKSNIKAEQEKHILTSSNDSQEEYRKPSNSLLLVETKEAFQSPRNEVECYTINKNMLQKSKNISDDVSISSDKSERYENKIGPDSRGVTNATSSDDNDSVSGYMYIPIRKSVDTGKQEIIRKSLYSDSNAKDIQTNISKQPSQIFENNLAYLPLEANVANSNILAQKNALAGLNRDDFNLLVQEEESLDPERYNRPILRPNMSKKPNKVPSNEKRMTRADVFSSALDMIIAVADMDPSRPLTGIFDEDFANAKKKFAYYRDSILIKSGAETKEFDITNYSAFENVYPNPANPEGFGVPSINQNATFPTSMPGYSEMDKKSQPFAKSVNLKDEARPIDDGHWDAISSTEMDKMLKLMNEYNFQLATTSNSVLTLPPKKIETLPRSKESSSNESLDLQTNSPDLKQEELDKLMKKMEEYNKVVAESKKTFVKKERLSRAILHMEDGFSGTFVPTEEFTSLENPVNNRSNSTFTSMIQSKIQEGLGNLTNIGTNNRVNRNKSAALPDTSRNDRVTGSQQSISQKSLRHANDAADIPAPTVDMMISRMEEYNTALQRIQGRVVGQERAKQKEVLQLVKDMEEYNKKLFEEQNKLERRQNRTLEQDQVLKKVGDRIVATLQTAKNAKQWISKLNINTNPALFLSTSTGEQLEKNNDSAIPSNPQTSEQHFPSNDKVKQPSPIDDDSYEIINPEKSLTRDFSFSSKPRKYKTSPALEKGSTISSAVSPTPKSNNSDNKGVLSKHHELIKNLSRSKTIFYNKSSDLLDDKDDEEATSPETKNPVIGSNPVDSVSKMKGFTNLKSNTDFKATLKSKKHAPGVSSSPSPTSTLEPNITNIALDDKQSSSNSVETSNVPEPTDSCLPIKSTNSRNPNQDNISRTMRERISREKQAIPSLWEIPDTVPPGPKENLDPKAQSIHRSKTFAPLSSIKEKIKHTKTEIPRRPSNPKPMVEPIVTSLPQNFPMNSVEPSHNKERTQSQHASPVVPPSLPSASLETSPHTSRQLETIHKNNIKIDESIVIKTSIVLRQSGTSKPSYSLESDVDSARARSSLKNNQYELSRESSSSISRDPSKSPKVKGSDGIWKSLTLRRTFSKLKNSKSRKE